MTMEREEEQSVREELCFIAANHQKSRYGEVENPLRYKLTDGSSSSHEDLRNSPHL